MQRVVNTVASSLRERDDNGVAALVGGPTYCAVEQKIPALITPATSIFSEDDQILVQVQVQVQDDDEDEEDEDADEDDD